MMLINIWCKLKSSLPQPGRIFSLSSLFIVSLASIAGVILFFGDQFSWHHTYPLSNFAKRIYIILVLLLLGLLKFLLLDFGTAPGVKATNLQMRRKLSVIHQRFLGALHFLKRTKINKKDRAIFLSQLPWHLLIGPKYAGKTSLLSTSGINFILQRRIKSPQTLISENCDWWITRDNSIIDVPGVYMQENALFWRYFLGLIKKYRSKQLAGVIVTLPLSEWLNAGDQTHKSLVTDILVRLRELQHHITHPLTCQIIITKCDLLPGFKEFFAESSQDEITQAWGIQLSCPNKESLETHFIEKFNALIKKLNQQLLWRLHQERNPFTRPFIKDFPLQLEQLKIALSDFFKKIDASDLHFEFQGIYLTSALQNNPIDNEVASEFAPSEEKMLQLFKTPAMASRAYFSKQVLSQGLYSAPKTEPTLKSKQHPYLIYALSLSLILFSAIIFGRDFKHGLNDVYAIQAKLVAYQQSMSNTTELDKRLIQTSQMLVVLNKAADHSAFNIDLKHLTIFYSLKAKQKAQIAYNNALNSLLLPEMNNYLSDYLSSPTNKTAENMYAAFKVYLMLGDVTHADTLFVVNALKNILPASISGQDRKLLLKQIRTALNRTHPALTLNPKLIEQIRTYFTAMPDLHLSYIILENTNSDNLIQNNFLSQTAKNLFSANTNTQIPNIYTVQRFHSVIDHDINQAAAETILGNWVLGHDYRTIKDAELIEDLKQQLRATYINNYVQTWENLLGHFEVQPKADLNQIDRTLAQLTGVNSPLLQLLQLLHSNTYFEPIISMSLKLQKLSALIDKSQKSETLLYQIFSSLSELHHYLQPIVNAQNEKEAAFKLMSKRLQTSSAPDALTQLKSIADKTPEPIKYWLTKISNDTWHHIISDAGHYLDTSWHEQVMHYYEEEIANRYPFDSHATRDVELQKFIDFFGNNGVLDNFYKQYLVDLINTDTPEWRWRSSETVQLPFANDTLRRIQQAMHIKHVFFNNQNNELALAFTLKPYKLADDIQDIQFDIDQKHFVDTHNTVDKHLITWPNTNTDIKLTLANQQVIERHFDGLWGWFKLVNQAFDSVVSKKEMVINLSENEHPAKYLLYTKGEFNPLIALNLRHFQLPTSIINDKVTSVD